MMRELRRPSRGVRMDIAHWMTMGDDWIHMLISGSKKSRELKSKKRLKSIVLKRDATAARLVAEIKNKKANLLAASRLMGFVEPRYSI